MALVHGGVARVALTLARGVGLFSVPAVIGLELASTAWGAPVPATIALLVAFACAFFGASAGAAAPVERSFGARATGAAVAALGLMLCVPTLRALAGHAPAQVPALASVLVRPEWRVVLPVVGAALVACGAAFASGRSPDARDAGRFGLLVALLFVAMLAGGLRVQGLPVLPASAARGPATTAAALALAGALAPLPLPLGVRAAGVVVAAVALRATGLGVWQLDPATRDMLPLAQSAADAWLAGESPYGVHQMQRGSEVPLTYLPGMWLLHAAPRALGVDPRWTGIASDVAIVGAALWAAGGAPSPSRRAARGLALGLGAAWLFSPSVHWNGVYAEPHPWWGLLALLAAATCRGRLWLAAGLLGAAVLTRHFALVLAPFVALAMAATAGWRGAAVRLAASGACFAPALAWFVARDPEAFWFGTFRWLLEYGPAHQSWFHEKYGFSGTLYRLGHLEWLHVGQLVGVAVCFALALARRVPRFRLAAGALALVVFVCFNRIIWDSFFLDGVVLALVLAAGGASVAPAIRPPARAVLALGACGALVTTVAGVWLGHSMARFFDRSGRAELRASVEGSATPATVVVDRTDFHLAFVRGEPLVPGLGARTWPDLVQLRAEGFALPLAERVVWVARDSRDEDTLASVLRLAGATEPRAHGRYRSLELTSLGAWRSLLRSSPPRGGAECRAGRPQRRYPGVRTGEELRWERAALGRALVVVGRVDESQVVWRGADAHLEIEIDGERAGTLHVPNRPGPSWTVVEPGGAGSDRSLSLRARPGKHGHGVVCVDVMQP